MWWRPSTCAAFCHRLPQILAGYRCLGATLKEGQYFGELCVLYGQGPALNPLGLSTVTTPLDPSQLVPIFCQRTRGVQWVQCISLFSYFAADISDALNLLFLLPLQKNNLTEGPCFWGADKAHHHCHYDVLLVHVIPEGFCPARS
jgi:hypothetical protein